jgi:hypothetical protein
VNLSIPVIRVHKINGTRVFAKKSTPPEQRMSRGGGRGGAGRKFDFSPPLSGDCTCRLNIDILG